MRLFAAFVRHPVEYGEPLASDGSEGGVKPPPSPREDLQVIMVSPQEALDGETCLVCGRPVPWDPGEPCPDSGDIALRTALAAYGPH